MTKTTDLRQLRMTIDSILTKYGIDNLQLSIDLSSAVRTYFNETTAGNSPVDVRKRIEESMQVGAVRAEKLDAMESRIHEAMGLRVSEEWHRAGVINFLIAQDAKGKTIEVFAEQCRKHPYSMPKPYQIAQKPSLLISDWDLAFLGVTVKKTDEEMPAYKPYVRDDSKAVPNPYPKPKILRKEL